MKTDFHNKTAHSLGFIMKFKATREWLNRWIIHRWAGSHNIATVRAGKCWSSSFCFPLSSIPIRMLLFMDQFTVMINRNILPFPRECHFTTTVIIHLSFSFLT